MQTLTIFYDPDCGLCTNFKRWLITQESYPALDFNPYNSEQASARLPIIADLDPASEIVVMADDGRWWQGPAAWVTCLWALKRYRAWSFRLATPKLLPIVAKLCHLLSENRLQVSHLLRLQPEALNRVVSQLHPTHHTCPDSSCVVSSLQKAKQNASHSPSA